MNRSRGKPYAEALGRFGLLARSLRPSVRVQVVLLPAQTTNGGAASTAMTPGWHIFGDVGLAAEKEGAFIKRRPRHGGTAARAYKHALYLAMGRRRWRLQDIRTEVPYPGFDSRHREFQWRTTAT